MVELIDWQALIDTVEGNEALTSCTIVEGLPRPSMQPIPPKAKPNSAPLVTVLRSNVEIPRAIRDWLANLLSAEETSCSCRLILKRQRGQPSAMIGRNWDVAMRFEELRETLTRQRAVGQCEKEFKVSRATVEKSIRDYRAARDEHEKVLREG